MRPGLSTPLGSKPSFTRLFSARKAGILRLEHIDRGAHRGRRAHQRGVAADGCDRAADRGGVGLVGERHRHPDQAAAPVVEHLRRRRDRGRDLVALARRGRNPPERPRARRIGGEGFHLPHAAPQRARVFFVEQRDRAERLHQRGERLLAMLDRRRKALQPQRGRRLRLRQAVEIRRDMIGQMRGAGHIAGRAHRRRHGGAGARVVEAFDDHGRFGLRPWAALSR